MNKTLLDAFLHTVNHYSAVLPYNLNWGIALDGATREWLSAHPLVVCDVGARGAPIGELAPLLNYIDCRAFDADEDECRRLNAQPSPYRAFNAYPYFVGATHGEIDFHIYRRPGESSVYEPDPRYQRLFGGPDFAIARTVKLQSITLDAVAEREKFPPVDMLKLDTQGSELGVLEGASRVLEGALLVEVEVEFLSMYAGQPLFSEVNALMRARGFELLYLNRVFAQRSQLYRGPARGQLVFGDALYGRREDALSAFGTARLLGYLVLLINYGHLDLAHQIAQEHPELALELPSLMNSFNEMKSYGWFEKLKRGSFSQLDKLAALLLHLRKTNQLNWDSDRSWPTR